MKKFFLASILLWQSLSLASGSVSGGGGGTLPSDPVSTNYIYTLLREIKRDVRLVLRNEDWSSYLGTPDEMDKLLYRGSRTILDALEETGLEIAMTKPCYDADKKEVDASVHATKQGDICVSAFRIAPKLIEERAYIETTALIVHELVHLMGGTEVQATDYQRKIAMIFKTSRSPAPDYNTTRFLTQDYMSKIYQSTYAIESVLDKLSTMSDLELSNQMRNVDDLMGEVTSTAFKGPYSMVGAYEEYFLQLQHDRVKMLAWYAWSVGADDKALWQSELKRVFGDKNQITYGDYKKANGQTSLKNAYEAEPMKRVTSRQELNDELLEIKTYLSKLGHLVHQISYNLALPKQLVPQKETVNPWEKFRGKYAIESRDCKSTGYDTGHKYDLVGFDVYTTKAKDGKDYLWLRMRSQGGEGNDGLFDGAGDVMGGADVTVSGDNVSATRRAELGTKWSENWTRHSFKILREADQIKMVETIRSVKSTSTDETSNFLECTYYLKQVQ